jgi:hypothetical protein
MDFLIVNDVKPSAMCLKNLGKSTHEGRPYRGIKMKINEN